MSPDRFEHQLSLVAPLISKKSTKLRSPISAAERLTFQIGRSTVSNIIRETRDAIWTQLRETYVSTPKSPQEWKRISEEFSSVWNFPHCIGAGDGKHLVIDCPENTGSNFFNDKGAFSIVLLAYGDANYCFTAVDLGQYGSGNDSGAFVNSEISKAFESNSFNVPEAEHVQGYADKLPYVTVVDEGLSLKQYQMCPYPGKISRRNVQFLTVGYPEQEELLKTSLGFSLHDGKFFFLTGVANHSLHFKISTEYALLNPFYRKLVCLFFLYCASQLFFLHFG